MTKKTNSEETEKTLQELKWDRFFRNPEKVETMKKVFKDIRETGTYDHDSFVKAIVGSIIDKAVMAGPITHYKYLELQINLEMPENIILAEVKKKIKEYKKQYKFDADKRMRLDSEKEYMTVWDQRSLGLSFTEIATDNKISIDLAHKRFYRAFEIIRGEKYKKNTWKELLKNHLAHIAKTEKPQDKKFWGRVMKMETSRQIDLPQNEHIQNESMNNTADASMMVRDLIKLCLKCPDTGCREKTTKCLSEFAAGGDNAFDDFKPDCPKFYTYLKN